MVPLLAYLPLGQVDSLRDNHSTQICVCARTSSQHIKRKNKLPSRIKPPLYPLFSTEEPHGFVLYLVTAGAVPFAAEEKPDVSVFEVVIKNYVLIMGGGDIFIIILTK